jgi:hypothetical protein
LPPITGFLLSNNRLKHKRIDGKASSVDDFLSKVSEKLDKDNAHILQQQVCYLNDGSGDFFVDCLTTERENAFVDKVIKDLEAMYNNKPKDSLPQTQKTDKISPSLDKRYLEEYLNSPFFLREFGG